MQLKKETWILCLSRFQVARSFYSFMPACFIAILARKLNQYVIDSDSARSFFLFKTHVTILDLESDIKQKPCLLLLFTIIIRIRKELA